MLKHEVAVHEVETALRPGQPIIGCLEGDIGDAGSGSVSCSFGKHVRGYVEGYDVAEGGGEGEAEPSDAAAMVECPATREGTKMLFVSSKQAGDPARPRREEDVAAFVYAASGEALVGEHAEIGIVATPLLPRLVCAEHKVF
jgi:hypothetical protein